MFFSWPKFSGSEQASLGINCGRRLIPSSFVLSKVILMDSFDFTFCNTIISINNLLLPEWILYMISTGVDPNLENSGTAVWAGTREAAFMANVKSTFRWFLQKTTFSLVKSRLALELPGCLFVTMPKMAQYTGKWLLTAPLWSHPKWNPFPDQTKARKEEYLVQPVFCMVW